MLAPENQYVMVITNKFICIQVVILINGIQATSSSITENQQNTTTT
jgi:hypothetical protein